MSKMKSFVVSYVGVALLMLSQSSWALSMDVAVVTSVQGPILQIDAKETGQPLIAFSKLHQGDKLEIKQNSRMQLVYFESGRQETWSGPGVVEIGTQASNSSLKPEVKLLPPLLAKQLSKTPASNVQGRAGMIVMRSISTPEKLKSIDENYASLRSQVAPNELSPELYLLSALFEAKEFERIKAYLVDLGQQFPDRDDVKDVISHYGRMVTLATSK